MMPTNDLILKDDHLVTVYVVSDIQFDRFVFTELADALDYIKEGFENELMLSDGDSFKISIEFMTQSEIDAIPEE